jgi:hypothetical protein
VPVFMVISFTDVAHVGRRRADATVCPVRRILERESEACAYRSEGEAAQLSGQMSISRI